jgi:hypothetical protein
MLTHPRVPSFWFFAYKLFSSWIWLKYCLLDLKQSINQSISLWPSPAKKSYYWKERWNKWIQKKEIQKKRKRQKEERIPVSPPYHGIFMLKSNVEKFACWPIPESPLSDFLFANFSHPEYDWNIVCWTLSNQSINQCLFRRQVGPIFIPRDSDGWPCYSRILRQAHI